MKRYWRIFRILIDQAVSYEAQYRKDTWLHLGTNILWIGMMFTIIEVIFRQTTALGGWERKDVYLLTVLWVIADEIYTIIFKRNLWNIPDLVTRGHLDAYLVYPIHPLFLVSTRIFLMRALYRLCIQLGILGFLILQFDFAQSIWHILLVPPLLICSVLINYAVTLWVNTLSFWFFRIDNVNDLWESITIIGRYPLSVLPRTLKILFLTFIPVAFLGHIPVATLLGRWPIEGVLYAFVFTAIAVFAAVTFWNFAAKRYSSASS